LSETVPVLGDPAVLEAADRDAWQRHRAAAVRALQRPSLNDPVSVGHLVEDLDPEVREDRAVQRDRARDAVLAVELERVDVIDEVVRLQVAGTLEIATGADLLERRAGVQRSVIHGRRMRGRGRPRRELRDGTGLGKRRGGGKTPRAPPPGDRRRGSGSRRR